jgi:hypothetical protein
MVESENALQESIKRRGDKSYYYAHAPRNVDDPSTAKILEGEGIVTGGDPKLLVSDIPKPEQPKHLVNIRNYNWGDEDDKVEISTPFDGISESLDVLITTDSVQATFNTERNETKKLLIKPLNKSVIPETSSYRITRRNKLIITLAKMDPDATWYQLTSS